MGKKSLERIPFFFKLFKRAYANVMPVDHSHSIVAGGLSVISKVTRPTSFTALVMREEISSKSFIAKGYTLAVMASVLVIALNARTQPYIRSLEAMPTDRIGSNIEKACQISS